MIESKIPGIKATHAVISPTCRANRTATGAFDEAVRRLRESYEGIVAARTDEYDCHIVLTVAKREHDGGEKGGV